MVVNQMNSDVQTKDAYLRHGFAILMTIAEMVLMNPTVLLTLQVQNVNTINLPAHLVINAYQEATTVIKKEIVKMEVMKLGAVSIYFLIT